MSTAPRRPASRLLARLPVSIGQVGTLSAATLLAQCILFGAAPLLTRLYTPDELGAFAALTGAAALAATAAGASYPTAIQLARDVREANDLLWATLLLTTVVACIGGAMVAWLSPDSWRAGEVSPLVLAALFALTVTAISAWTSARAFAVREELFRPIASSTVADAGFQATLQVGLGAAGAGLPGVVGGYVVGKVAAAVALVFAIRTRMQRPYRPHRAAWRWRRFPLWYMPTALLGQATVSAAGPLVAALYGTAVTGQFSLAMRMLAVPSVLLGQAVGTVFLPKVVRLSQLGQDLLPTLQRTASALTAIAIPAYGTVLLLGPELFSVVFGDQWREAGIIAAMLAPWLALSLVSSPVSIIPTVHDRLKALLTMAVLDALLRSIALWIGHLANNTTLGFGAYSLAGCGISIYFLAWTFRLSGGRLTKWLRTESRYAGPAVTVIILLWFSRPLLDPFAYLVLCSSVCVALGTLGIRAMKRLLMESAQPASDAVTPENTQ